MLKGEAFNETMVTGGLGRPPLKDQSLQTSKDGLVSGDFLRVEHETTTNTRRHNESLPVPAGGGVFRD